MPLQPFEATQLTAEVGQLLQEALLTLPQQFRSVIMRRDIEELSTGETAEALEITEENVKIRLHRGRALMRAWLFQRFGAKAKEAFPFMGARCDRVVRNAIYLHKLLPRMAALTAGTNSTNLRPHSSVAEACGRCRAPTRIQARVR